MSYAVVHDIAASWEHYQPIAEAIGRRSPEGLILHAAGRTDEGFRIIALWESEGDWDRFRTEGLAGLPGGRDGVPAPQVVVRALQVEHVVTGHPRAGAQHASDRSPEQIEGAVR